MAKSITVKYGPGRQITTEFPDHYTVGQVVQSDAVRAALQAGANVRALIDRVEQDPSAPTRSGDVIELETRASQKG